MEKGGTRALVVTGKPTDGIVSKYLNRKISTRITGFLVEHNISITPNQVSVISFLIALMSVYFFIFGPLWLAGVLIQISSIVDGVDGELARARGIASKKGGFLDTMLDRYADVAIIVSATLAVYMTCPSLLWFLVGLMALSGDILVSYIHSRAQMDFGVHPAVIGRLPSIASRDVRLFIIFLGGCTGFLGESLIAVAFLSHVYVIVKIYEIFRSI